jgi:SAM-dependent methyltransferase
MDNSMDSQYWNNRYLLQQTGWDIGYVSTPIKTYIDQLENKKISILIPGCGNGYEVEYLLEKGFQDITVIDIAPAAIEKLSQKLQRFLDSSLTVITGDFFTLAGHFDLVLEQTFFCALDPSLRNDYARKMNELLHLGGKLAGVLFNREFEGGPPFGGTSTEYKKLFSPFFLIKKIEACYNSIDARKDSEVFIILEARK